MASSFKVLACSLPHWYQDFKHITVKSLMMELPPDFIAYLRQDGVVMPEEVEEEEISRSDWSDSDNDGEDEGDEEVEKKRPSFPELTGFIKSAMTTFGGPVFPKLNWSSPKDAAWVNGGTTKCTHARDVYTLLKSSDFVMHDVDFALDESCRQGFSFSLVLRKWCNLHRSMEFRCFVKDNEIVAASQRDVTQCYPFLKEERQETLNLLLIFFQDHVRNRFSGGAITQYVMDVYVDRRSRVWLLDFNIFNPTTDSLLFEWSELDEIGSTGPELRIVQVEKEVRTDPLSSYRAPIDTVQLASGQDFDSFKNLCVKPSKLDQVD